MADIKFVCPYCNTEYTTSKELITCIHNCEEHSKHADFYDNLENIKELISNYNEASDTLKLSQAAIKDAIGQIKPLADKAGVDVRLEALINGHLRIQLAPHKYIDTMPLFRRIL